MGSFSTYSYRSAQLNLLDLFSDESICGSIIISDGIGGKTKNLSIDASKMQSVYDILTSHQADAVTIGKGVACLLSLTLLQGQCVLTSCGDKTMQELGEAVKDILSDNSGTTSLPGIVLGPGEADQYAITLRNGRGGVSKALNLSHDEVKLIDRTIRPDNNVESGLAIGKLLNLPLNEKNSINTSIGPKTLLDLGETIMRLYTTSDVLANTAIKTDKAFVEQGKALKDAEVQTFTLLKAQPLLLDGKPLSGTLEISYKTGDKPLQVANLRLLSEAFSKLATEYEALP